MSRLLLLPPYQPGNVPSQPSAGQVIVATGTRNQVKGVTQGVLSQSAIPFVITPTGTMANNGAITLGTALPTTYANAYLYLPASAISAGSTAGWYFAQMSSATLGTVFNNTYSSGTPTIPASPTAFATTGPGAYTGVVTPQTMPAITIPGNVMGLNGTVRYSLSFSVPNNADSKTYTVAYAGSAIMNAAVTTSLTSAIQRSFSNRGKTNSQVNDGGLGLFGPGSGGGACVYTSADSTANQTLAIQGQLAVATDYIVLEKYVVEVFPG